MDILEEITQQFTQGDMAVFIGAGFSMNSGLPGWSKLTQPIAEITGSPWPSNERDLTSDHFLKAMQYYDNQFGRNRLIHYLKDQLGTTGSSPSLVHDLLCLLPARIIFTTNYDNLIEKAFHKNNITTNTIVNEVEFSYWNNSYVQIIKLCGDLGQPASIVATKYDYNIYMETHSRMVDFLRSTLETKGGLFLGYSLQDPFFNQIWDNIGRSFGRHRRPGYAVMFNTSDLERKDLRSRGVHVIELESGKNKNVTETFSEWLNHLVEMTTKTSSINKGSKS